MGMHNDGKRPLQVVLSSERSRTPVEKAKSSSLTKLSALKRKAKTGSATAMQEQLANGRADKDEELTSDLSSAGGGSKSGSLNRSETAKAKLKAMKKTMRK